MNQEQAKAWLPLIQAVADGKTIQAKVVDALSGEKKETWNDCTNFLLQFIKSEISPKGLRIKPEPKKAWYRVVLFKNGTTTAETEYEEKRWSENNSNFIRWLTDRIEYELPEGEA